MESEQQSYLPRYPDNEYNSSSPYQNLCNNNKSSDHNTYSQQQQSQSQSQSQSQLSSENNTISKKSTNFEPKNVSCPLCRKNIEYSGGSNTPAVVYIPSCQHIFHAKCGESFISNNSGNQCPICKNKHFRRFSNSDDEDEDDGEGFLIDHGNDANYTNFLQQKYGNGDDEIYDENFWSNYYHDNRGTLTIFQKNKLLKNVMNPIKIKKMEINLAILEENESNMQDILDCGADILDIYFSMNIKQ